MSSLEMKTIESLSLNLDKFTWTRDDKWNYIGRKRIKGTEDLDMIVTISKYECTNYNNVRAYEDDSFEFKFEYSDTFKRETVEVTKDQPEMRKMALDIHDRVKAYRKSQLNQDRRNILKDTIKLINQ